MEYLQVWERLQCNHHLLLGHPKDRRASPSTWHRPDLEVQSGAVA